MPTFPSGSRSKWWGECQEWWPLCVAHFGRREALSFSPLLSSDAWVSLAGWLVVGVRWEVEEAVESWPGGKSALPEPCRGDGEGRVCSQGMSLKLFMMST